MTFLGVPKVKDYRNQSVYAPAEERENSAQRNPLFCSISSHVAIPKASLRRCSVTLPMPPICNTILQVYHTLNTYHVEDFPIISKMSLDINSDSKTNDASCLRQQLE